MFRVYGIPNNKSQGLRIQPLHQPFHFFTLEKALDSYNPPPMRIIKELSTNQIAPNRTTDAD